jgi:hypothetical protein
MPGAAWRFALLEFLLSVCDAAGCWVVVCSDDAGCCCCGGDVLDPPDDDGWYSAAVADATAERCGGSRSLSNSSVLYGELLLGFMALADAPTPVDEDRLSLVCGG